MTGFTIKTGSAEKIRFKYYSEAPVTSQAFDDTLPFTQTFYHAKISGEELWCDKTPVLDIIQENASAFGNPGEIVIAPKNPSRIKIAGFMGIFYGEGKLLDCANIFGKVYDEDAEALRKLGESFWKEGFKELMFEKIA